MIIKNFSSILNSYYSISNIDVIFGNNDKVKFLFDGSVYSFFIVDSIDEVFSSYYLSRKVNYCYSFVFNNYGSHYTEIESLFYILILCNDKVISLEKLLFIPYYDIPYHKMYCNWKSKWISRVDYIENYYPSIIYKYPYIDESISYFLSLAELAIYKLREFDYYHDISFIQHRYIFIEEDYYNPLSLIIDLKERDLAEYLRYLFISRKYLDIDLTKLILEHKNYNYFLVIARLIFPSYYFYLFDSIVLGNDNDFVLKNVISRIVEYEEYINNIISIVNGFLPIKKVSF